MQNHPKAGEELLVAPSLDLLDGCRDEELVELFRFLFGPEQDQSEEEG